MEEHWKTVLRGCILGEYSGAVSIDIDMSDLSQEQQNQIEEAAEAFFNLVRKVLKG